MARLTCADDCGYELSPHSKDYELCQFCESNYLAYRRQHPGNFRHLRVQWLNDRDRKFFIHEEAVTLDEYFAEAYGIYVARDDQLGAE